MKKYGHDSKIQAGIMINNSTAMIWDFWTGKKLAHFLYENRHANLRFFGPTGTESSLERFIIAFVF